MRKYLLLAVGMIAALALPSVASANTQGVRAKVAPRHLSSKYSKPTSINVVTTTAQDPGKTGANAIDGAYRGRVYFDKDISFFTKGYPTCKASQVDGVQDPSTVLSKCGKALVGSGAGLVALGGYVDPVTNQPPPANVLAAKIYALNGKRHGGNPVILLHSIVPGVSATTLVGTLKHRSGSYRTLLDVAIEPLPGGTAIIRFQAKIRKKYRYKGKRVSYVSARCTHKKFRYKGTFYFENYSDPAQKSHASGADTQPCTGYPETKITTRNHRTFRRKAKIRFKSNLNGSRFKCKLDGRRYRKCRSPYRVKKVGRHTLRVEAIKGHLKERSPAKVKFRVKK